MIYNTATTMRLLSLTFYLFVISSSFGQNTVTNSVNNSSLEENGIYSTNIPTSITNEDLENLKTFDFSPYRLYSTSQKIQIENGPIIELFSVEKMILKGQIFSEEYILSKKNTDFSTVVHSVMPKVKTGYGLIPAETLH